MSRSIQIRTAARRCLAAASLIWLLLAALPVIPFAIGTGMDASWNYALNIAHAKGVPFGTHLFFTMGPLGYLATPDPAYTGWVPVLVFIATTYLLLVYGVLRFAWFRGIGHALAIAAVLAAQVLFTFQYPDVWQAAYMAVFLAAAASCSLRDLALAGLAAGFTLLFKLNEGITACAVFACLIAYNLWRRPAARAAHLAIAAIPVVTLLAGMQILQGSWYSAIPYLRNSLDVMGGFSRAASMPGPVWQSGLAAAYLVAVFAAAIGLGGRSALLGPGFVPALLIAFAAFKHGMVRQDGHADMAAVKIAIAILFLMLARIGPRYVRTLGALALVGAAATVCIVAANQPWLYLIGIGRIQPAGIASSARALAAFRRHWEAQPARIDGNLQPLRLDRRFSQIVGAASIDAFPENIDVIRANGWNYQPRPGIQSSASFTPRLDRINAEYIENGRASEYALFVWYAIDGRHPFLQDTQSLLALLNYYDVIHTDDRALLLKRRAARKFREPEWIGSSDVSWNQVVRVPAAGPGEALLSKIEIAPSLWGDIRSFLFRASPVYLQVNYREGQGFDRVVTPSLAGGAIISPLPQSLPDLAAFLEGRAAPNPVVNIEWISAGSRLEYKGMIRMSWYRLRRADREEPSPRSGLAVIR